MRTQLKMSECNIRRFHCSGDFMNINTMYVHVQVGIMAQYHGMIPEYSMFEYVGLSRELEQSHIMNIDLYMSAKFTGIGWQSNF